jgi:hypothetical protein
MMSMRFTSLVLLLSTLILAGGFAEEDHYTIPTAEQAETTNQEQVRAPEGGQDQIRTTEGRWIVESVENPPDPIPGLKEGEFWSSTEVAEKYNKDDAYIFQGEKGEIRNDPMPSSRNRDTDKRAEVICVGNPK